MRLALFITLTLLAACAVREQADFVSVPQAEVAHVVPVLVATMRADDPEQPIPGWERAPDLRFGRFDVSIPINRDPGDINRQRNRATPDPARHFMLASGEMLSRAAFDSNVRSALARSGDRSVMIYVHGFNTAFVEGVYRAAQIESDYSMPGVMMHYSWPSLGVPLAYAYDRDSALIARDGLVEMIDELRRAGVQKLHLLAHSMGSQLVMESLRQMSIARDPALRTIRGVTLMSPDIDVELFREQARRIGNLPQPFVIVTSQRDRILLLSAQLTGERTRLGNLSDPSEVAGLDVTLVDVSAFSRGAGHFTAASSPELIAMVQRAEEVNAAFEADASGALPLLPATILTLQNTTQVIVEPISGASRPDASVRRPWWRRLIGAVVRD